MKKDAFPALRSFSTVVLLLLFTPVVLPAKQQTIGVYDLDSVIMSVPHYKSISDSLENIETLLRRNRDLLKAEMDVRLIEAGRDSMKWSAVIKSLKLAEIINMGINIQNYDRQMKKEIDQLHFARKTQILDKINVILAELCNKKKYAAIIQRTEMPMAISDSTSKKSVTSEIIGSVLMQG